MCMATIDKRTVLEKPILAWKVVLKRSNDWVQSSVRRDPVRVGQWMKAKRQPGTRSWVGSRRNTWGFHTYARQEDAERIANAWGPPFYAVPVAIVGRAAWGNQRFTGEMGWTAEWIYYLKTGILA